MRTQLRLRTLNLGRRMLLVVLSVIALLSDGPAVRALSNGIVPVELSCAAPADAGQAQLCETYAQAILDTTVLLRMVSRCTDRPEGLEWWVDSHATIVDDRTVITHNHYRILGDERCTLHALKLYTAQGEVMDVITDATVLEGIRRQLNPQDGPCQLETCVVKLDQPYFKPCADLRIIAPEQEGAAEQVAMVNEIAEINWNGYPGSTYVQWTRPVGLSNRGDVPVLELATRIREGASGGGAYVVTTNGLVHVGNEWLTKVDREGSVVALNPPATNW